MAEKHDLLLSRYRDWLVRRRYEIRKKSPFVDYRPDIFAQKGKEKVFVEVEIDGTLHNDHTLRQLEKMYEYLRKSRNYCGYLVVPSAAKKQAELLIESVFGDQKIRVAALP